MSKHTPGPWVADTENAWPVQTGCCPLVGRPYSIAHGTRNVAAASKPEDARLIAAAPDLLEACKAALSDDQPYIAKCRAAIAKATGATTTSSDPRDTAVIKQEQEKS